MGSSPDKSVKEWYGLKKGLRRPLCHYVATGHGGCLAAQRSSTRRKEQSHVWEISAQ